MATRYRSKQFDLMVLDDGIVSCMVVQPEDGSCEDAVRTFQEAVGREMARRIPAKETDRIGKMSCGLLVLGKPETHPILKELEPDLDLNLEWLGEEGFSLRGAVWNGRPVLAVVGRTEAGVRYGVQHLIDRAWLPEGRSLVLEGKELSKVPDFGYRSAYNLTCWGNAAKNSPQGWKGVIDNFAASGLNRQWFWISGMYRSKSVPDSFWAEQTDSERKRDYTWGYGDSPMDNHAIRELIAYARKRGIKLHLHTGLFEWHYTHSTREDPKVRSRCPSFPASREYATKYVTEILETFPEVEGLALEVRGEDGGCDCELCSRVIDEDGSRQFCESLASYLKELFERLWKIKPDLELSITLGYRNASTDVNYLEKISRMDDPRFTVWVCRPQPGGMPARGGTKVPPRHYFKNAVVWVPANRMSFEDIREKCQESAADGMVGVVTECDPGWYQTTNLWHDYDVPYDGEELCFRATQFGFNLFSWDRELTMKEFRKALHQRFFDPLVPEQMTDLLMELVDVVHKVSGAWQGRNWPIKSGGSTLEEWVQKRDVSFWEGWVQRLRDQRSFWEGLPGFLETVSERIGDCEVGTSRRARRTLAAMREIVLDIQGPLLGPEKLLFPLVEPSDEDPFPIMALAREAEDWVPRIEAALKERKEESP